MKIVNRKRARLLRKKGKSINQIVEKTGYSKASVSVWVRDIALTTKQKKRLSKRGRSLESIEKRRISRIKNEQAKRDRVISHAESSIGSISDESLRFIGSMLYWAEGRKRGQRNVSFSNSDPDMIRVMMTFFRKICEVDRAKFRCHVHIHSTESARRAEKYWSSVTGIPLVQFYKSYSKVSSSSQGKMSSLPFGTLDIIICDSGLFLKIIGWIRGISKKINK